MKDRIKVILFTIFIFIIPILTYFLPQADIAFYENRALAKWPDMTAETLFNRQFFDDAEVFISDHFPYREGILRRYVSARLALKAPVVNEIVVSGNILLPYHEYVIPNYNVNAMGQEMQMLRDFSDFCKARGTHFLYVGIPEQSSALAYAYPSHLNTSAYRDDSMKRDFFTGLEAYDIAYLDMHAYLAGEDAQQYYSETDHHYNLYGAYRTYLEIMEYINTHYFAAPVLTNLDIVRVESQFLGSRNRELLGAFETEDALYTYETESIPEFVRYDNGTRADSTVFDDRQRNTYNYYMGGDIAETVVQTNRPALPNALIFGDSFTNPIETLLFHSFDEMRSLDLRHYTKMNLYDYVEQHNPDIVICVRDDLSYILTQGNGDLSRW